MKIVALDFETANYRADSACAIGLAAVENGVVTGSKHILIRPPTNDFVFTSLHGISWSDVRHAPTFDEICPEIEAFWDGAEFLVAHNAAFDRKVLYTCYGMVGRNRPSHPFLCTVKLARTAWQLKPAKLPNVCDYLGIGLDHHNAASDSLACAQIIARAVAQGFSLDTCRLGPPGYTLLQGSVRSSGKRTTSSSPEAVLRQDPAPHPPTALASSGTPKPSQTAPEIRTTETLTLRHKSPRISTATQKMSGRAGFCVGIAAIIILYFIAG